MTLAPRVNSETDRPEPTVKYCHGCKRIRTIAKFRKRKSPTGRILSRCYDCRNREVTGPDWNRKDVYWKDKQ